MFEDCDSLKKEYLVILSVLVTISLSIDGNPVKTKEKKLFWYCSLTVSHFYECRGVESWEVACQKKVNICPTELSWGLISDIYFVRLLTPPLFSSPLSLALSFKIEQFHLLCTSPSWAIARTQCSTCALSQSIYGHFLFNVLLSFSTLHRVHRSPFEDYGLCSSYEFMNNSPIDYIG